MPPKRISNDIPTPTPGPSSVNPETIASPNHHQSPSSPRKILFFGGLISYLYLTSKESDPVLVPYDSEAINRKRKNGPQPFILRVTDEAGLEEEEMETLEKIVQKFVRKLIQASQRVEKEIEIRDVKLLVMIGNVLFHRSIKASANEDGHKTFYTRVPEEYIREVEVFLVEKCGFHFIKEKERYHIKVLDKDQSQLFITCKCKTSHDSALELYKVEHNPQRRMVTDVSCLSKNFDLRIMLSTKRVLKNLDDDVANGIKQLISAAVIDEEAKEKGGLRWPSGKESIDDRFFIVGVWHAKHRILRRGHVRVDLRKAGRFDFTKSISEDVNDISFKLTGLSELLNVDPLPEDSVVRMIQEVVDLIWQHLL